MWPFSSSGEGVGSLNGRTTEKLYFVASLGMSGCPAWSVSWARGNVSVSAPTCLLISPRPVSVSSVDLGPSTSETTIVQAPIYQQMSHLQLNLLRWFFKNHPWNIKQEILCNTLKKTVSSGWASNPHLLGVMPPKFSSHLRSS